MCIKQSRQTDKQSGVHGISIVFKPRDIFLDACDCATAISSCFGHEVITGDVPDLFQS